MSEEPHGWLTRRAVAALTRLAEASDDADGEWARGLLAEVDEVPPGTARLRWALGGLWMLLSGTIDDRRRLVVLARRPATGTQRMLALLLLPHAFLVMLGAAFAEGDFRIGDPRGPAFTTLLFTFPLVIALIWWRPVPGAGVGTIWLLAEAIVWLAPAGHTQPDGTAPATAQRILDTLPQVWLMIPPTIALLGSIAAISLAPRAALQGDRTLRGVLTRVGAWFALLALAGGGVLTAGWLAQVLGITGSWWAWPTGILFSLIVPVCALLGPLAALSRPLEAPSEPAATQ
jgi:hypothetical protein